MSSTCSKRRLSVLVAAAAAGCAAPPPVAPEAPPSSPHALAPSAPRATADASPLRIEPDGAPQCDAAASPTMPDLRATMDAAGVHFTVRAYFNLPVTPAVTSLGDELRVDLLMAARVPDCHGEIACLEAHPLPYCAIPYRVVGAGTARPLAVTVAIRVAGEEGRATLRIPVSGP